MNAESIAYSVDNYPELNKIWENPPQQLIIDPTSIELAINVQGINPNIDAVGFFGGQKGDEAKGTWAYRFAHIRHLANQGGVAVRAGGPGAGHEFVPDGASEEITMRMLPTAVDKDWIKIAGRAELVRPDLIIQELTVLRKMGFSPSSDNVMLDGTSFLAWEAHTQRDLAEETIRGKTAVGTTKSGVGPAASDYTARAGLRMHHLLLPQNELEKMLAAEIERQNRILESLNANIQFPEKDTVELFKLFAQELGPYIQNTYPVVQRALKESNFVYEAAQAFGISIDTGFPGSVTSTDSGPGTLERRYRTSREYLGWKFGVIKLVPTAVGRHLIHSPLPEEFRQKLYSRTEERGKPEEGRVSHRQRQYYWLSVPELRAAAETYGLNGWLVSKVDVADVLPEIHLGLEYVFPNGEKTTDYDPDDPRMLDEATRMNTLKLDGWQTSTAGMTEFEDAPKELKATVATLENLTGLPVAAVGTGPKFGEAIYAKNSPFDILEI